LIRERNKEILNRYTAEAINSLCDLVRVTRRGNENILDYSILEMCLRKDLEDKVRRTMAVVQPIKFVITNVDEKFCEKLIVPDFPKDPSRGTHEITVQKELYVEKSDIRLEDHKDFFGIAPGKKIG